jgi:hypothetical protein
VGLALEVKVAAVAAEVMDFGNRAGRARELGAEDRFLLCECKVSPGFHIQGGRSVNAPGPGSASLEELARSPPLHLRTRLQATRAPFLLHTGRNSASRNQQGQYRG